MRLLRKIVLVSLVLGLVWSLPLGVFARTPKVTFEYPDQIQAGENFILKVNINHPGQSKDDYVNKIKLFASSEPLKIWTYTTKTKSKDAKWTEKLTLSLDENTVLKAEVTTTKKEEVEKEDFLEVTGAEAAVATTEEADQKTEEVSDFGLTFWIFVVVVVIVIVVAIVYWRRKKKGLI